MRERPHQILARGAHVYVLQDPDTNLAMYVGQSRDVRARLNGHLAAARAWQREMSAIERAAERQANCVARRGRRLRFVTMAPRVPTELSQWLAACLEARQRPWLEVVETLRCDRDCGCPFVNECRRARLRESVWIDRLSGRGHPILNRALPTALPAAVTEFAPG